MLCDRAVFRMRKLACRDRYSLIGSGLFFYQLSADTDSSARLLKNILSKNLSCLCVLTGTVSMQIHPGKYAIFQIGPLLFLSLRSLLMTRRINFA